ncbi:MAG: LPXTG cell wall anchor domain-containing protein [Blautia sp.]|nr:LPXTG cell wall anchor domain-containing protein [Blautia sp.]
MNEKIYDILCCELPYTGGTGTKVIYIIGAILVFLAFVLLITKIRVDRKEKRKHRMDL